MNAYTACGINNIGTAFLFLLSITAFQYKEPGGNDFQLTLSKKLLYCKIFKHF